MVKTLFTLWMWNRSWNPTSKEKENKIKKEWKTEKKKENVQEIEWVNKIKNRLAYYFDR